MSDYEVGGSNTRRKRQPRLTSLSDSDSSDDSLIIPRRKGPKSRVISESSDSASEVDTRRRRRKKPDGKPVIVSESESDTGSIGDGVACPICLGKLDVTTLQGRPESCEHTFCFECIIAWSKNNTTCPLCRTSFTKMNIILRGDVLEELPVEKATPEVDPIDQFLNDILCLVCNRSDQEDSLLLCDECDDAYHCACLNPPLMRVPPGQWFCPRCSQNSIDGDSDDDMFVSGNNHSFHVPRTRATERVRRAVQSTRRTATSRRSGTGQRRTTTRTTSRTSTRGSTGSGRSRKSAVSSGKRRKYRRKTTRRRKGGRRLTILRKAYAASTDHQLRIAKSLGLSDRLLHKLNRNNVSFPVLSIDEPSTSRGTSSRSDSLGQHRPLAGVTPDLRIFGSNKDYVPQESSDDGGASPACIERQAEDKGAPSGLDFLDGLLEKQSVLLNKKSELKRDTSGKLRLVRESSKNSLQEASSSARRSRIEHRTSSTSRKQHSHDTARATCSSQEYDVRYKPQRISRVDLNSVLAVSQTIEDVVKQSQPLAETAESRRLVNVANTESLVSQNSNVPYANESHNVAKAKVVKESQGWINSLRLTVPTVINSLNVFQDLDGYQLPSSSSSSSSGGRNQRDFDFKSENVRVKQEPQETRNRSNSSSSSSSSSSSGSSHYAQDYNKIRSHHSDYKRGKKSKRSRDREGSRRPKKKALSPQRNRRRTPEISRSRNRSRSRSRGPLYVKKERRHSRSASVTPPRRSFNAESEQGRDLRHRKERPDSECRMKKKLSRPDRHYAPSTNGSDTVYVKSRGVKTLKQHLDESNRKPAGSDRTLGNSVIIEDSVPAVDLTRVKMEPVDYSSSICQQAEASRTLELELKTEPTIVRGSDAFPSLICRPSESSASTLLSADSSTSAIATGTITTAATTTKTTIATTTITTAAAAATTTTATTTIAAAATTIAAAATTIAAAAAATTSSRYDTNMTLRTSIEPLSCQAFNAASDTASSLETASKVELVEGATTHSNNNSSTYLEGYSSGMDSEESVSDVERALPQIIADTMKPIVDSGKLSKYVKYFVAREKFKDAVIKEVGPYLKKFYRKHQISKEDYKEIFKKVLKKVCTSSSEKKRLVCTKAIHKLCHIYVKRARIQIKLDCKFGDEP